MRVSFGTDEVSDVTTAILDHLTVLGHEVIGPVEAAWPLVGQYVGRAVAEGEADRGIVCCWTGTGVAMAANKVAGVRAALCSDSETARGARRWNDANVLALGLRLTSTPMAREIVEVFLSAVDVDPEEIDNIRRLDDPGVGSNP